MGRPGPAPTPAKLKLLRGETRPSRVNYDEPKAREGAPDMPAELTPAEQEVWRHTINELKAMGVLTRADRDALAAYCRFVVVFTEASAVLQREPLVIEGDRGCRVRNPALVQRDAAQQAIQGRWRPCAPSPAARGSRGEHPAQRRSTRRTLPPVLST